jgi:hypothetical protein
VTKVLALISSLLAVATVGVSSAAAATGCVPARVVVYAQTDWLRAASTLAQNQSACADNYVSVPPLAADKTQPRSGQASQIRALGPHFHALDEMNVTGWTQWVAAGNGTWFDAGVTARQRMAAAGFDVTSGDGWALNELSSAVRVGVGSARRNMLDFLHGLSNDGVKGVVLTTGIAQSTVDLRQYEINLQNWFEDSGFWTEAAGYASDWGQEVYGDIRDYAVSGSSPADRAAALAQYLGHARSLAGSAPAGLDPARSLVSQTFLPMGSAAWAWADSYGWTAAAVEVMEDFVSGQVYADRAFSASVGASVDRIGFAWSPRNLSGLPTGTFNSQAAAILTRIAAAIHDSDVPSDVPGAAACLPSWCATAQPGAAFTAAWQAFSTWAPRVPTFITAPFTAAVSTPALATVQLQTLGLPNAPTATRTITLTSGSTTGSFAADPAGPWSPTLAVTIAPGSTSGNAYYMDATAGAPMLTATLDDGTAASQTETITPLPAPAPPTTTTTAVTTPVVPKPKPLPPARVSSVRLQRLAGHLVVTVRVRRGAQPAGNVRVLINVHGRHVRIAHVIRTTTAAGVATWRSPHKVTKGRYSATAGVRTP